MHTRFDVSRRSNFINKYNSSPFTYNTTDLVSVIDSDGNTFQVHKDDPRLKSGEINGVTLGMVSAKRLSTGEHIHVSKMVFDTDSDLVGVTNGYDSPAKGKSMPPEFGNNLKISKMYTNRTHSKEAKENRKLRSKKGIPIGPHSQERKDNISKAREGKRWYKNPQGTDSRLLSDIVAPCYTLFGWVPGRVLKQVTCPRCSKIGGHSNMKRYHFDNCKHK